MYSKNPKVTALILAGGVGSRMHSNLTKQRMMLGNISILNRSVLAFENCDAIYDIVVVSRESELDEVQRELSGISKLRAVVPGGASRGESAWCGFSAANSDADFIAIHDAARPIVTPDMIKAVVSEAIKKGCATAATPVTDTIKVIDNDGRIVKTLTRDFLIRATTPQVFKKEIYERALVKNQEDLSSFTDDNMLVESIGEKVYSVVLKSDNPKITTPEDLKYAELLLTQRGELNV